MALSSETLSAVRRAVRSVLDRVPDLEGEPGLRRQIAEKMVNVSLAAADLIDEERRLTDEIGRRKPAPLASAQAAGDQHRQTAVRSAAGVLRSTREAIDFPGFVTSLITGVFQSITTSNIQQLQAFSDLLEAVDSSTDEFARSQIGDARAAEWISSRFDVFATETDGGEVRLLLRPNSEMPEPEALRRVLEATEDEIDTVDESELTETLLPLVKRKLARARQSMLATMVMMGLSRVVVDDGHLHASMNLQVDASSVAEQTTAERTDTRVSTSASGSFGMGMWGASASLSASVGYVRSDEQYSREEIALQAGLRSSVDIGFHTEHLPLSTLADDATQARIADRQVNPRVVAGRDEAIRLSQQDRPSLLTERHTESPDLGEIPELEQVAAPDSQEMVDLRRQRDFGAGSEAAADGGSS